MAKRNLLIIVAIVLVIVALGAQVWVGNDDPGIHQTDRDTVMNQAPTEPPTPPRPPAGRTGAGP